jgi:hypothetical protein
VRKEIRRETDAASLAVDPFESAYMWFTGQDGTTGPGSLA